MNNIYISKGYETRKNYLRTLAEDHDISEEIVFYLAELFGPNEDFNGLLFCINELEDMEEI